VKRAVALVGLVAAVATTAATASPPVAIVVAPSVVRPGQTVTIGGVVGTCLVGDTVTLISRAFVHTHDFAGLPALFTKVRPGHKFRTMTRIPTTKAPGSYRVTGRCGGGNLGVSASLRVRAATSLVVTPAAVHRGHSVTLRGSADGCPAGDTVTLISRAFVHTHDFAGLPAVLARVRAGGTFRTSTRIPLTKPPRRYGITARCGGGNLGVLAHLRVLP
jgi:hypothetical protein